MRAGVGGGGCEQPAATGAAQPDKFEQSPSRDGGWCWRREGREGAHERGYGALYKVATGQGCWPQADASTATFGLRGVFSSRVSGRSSAQLGIGRVQG